MSRCPYCRRELPGFKTLCQKCFEAGYERITHPKPWWQRRQWPKLTPEVVHVFTLVFLVLWGHSVLHIRMHRYHSPMILDSPLAWLAYALICAIVESTRKDSGEKPQR